MKQVSSLLNQIPSWIVTVIVALIVSYSTIQLKVNTLETKSEVIKERVNKIDADKANKELLQEFNNRLNRIESKLDRLIESKQ